MATNASDRATAIYNAISQANPMMSQASPSEQAKVRASLQTIFGGDLAYLVGAVTVLPSSMQAPAGASVQVAYPAGSGATTSPVGVVGTGRIS